MYDLLLKNGLIADGTGGEPYKADLAVKDGHIAAIAPVISDGFAKETVDNSGMCAAPGFIDIHSHSDTNFLQDDRCEAKIYQGVTTELMGQCGSSVYPCPNEHRGRIQEFSGSSAMGYASCSLEEFITRVENDDRRMGTNLLPLVGHGALRCGVMSYDDRGPTESELKHMRKLLRRDMESGAWGLSLGLGYTPGVSSGLPELCELGQEVAWMDGIVTSHMRYQNIKTPVGLEEMYEINRKSGAHVHIAHFKASGKSAWGKAPEFCENVHNARRSGINVTVDLYPYNASSSGITNSFPRWSIQGGEKHALEVLAGAERKRLIKDLEYSFAQRDAAQRLLVVSTQEHLPEADGKNIAELSDMWGISFAEAAARVCEETEAKATCISFSMNMDDVLYMLGQNDFSIGSDGCAHSFDPALNQGKPHPRNFGTFPRFLRLAREKGLCGLGMAVRRCTGLSADTIGIKDRGYLREGLAADITVFDPLTVSDRATFENPFQKPTGVHHVLMDGVFAIRDGAQTEARCGRILRKI